LKLKVRPEPPHRQVATAAVQVRLEVGRSPGRTGACLDGLGLAWTDWGLPGRYVTSCALDAIGPLDDAGPEQKTAIDFLHAIDQALGQTYRFDTHEHGIPTLRRA
jgi:hypothetical protein